MTEAANMEKNLRCNTLKCRAELTNQAVVTTCSHIFCCSCAERYQLSRPPDNQPKFCPACESRLHNPDDVIRTLLNPTEDYKTSVLSGLNPNIIMECAGRAISFWAYQTTQEIMYQEYWSKSLTEKYNNLNTDLDKTIHDANTEITALQSKLADMHLDQESLQRKNEELGQMLRDKNKKFMQTQELYDKLKRRAMLGQVQNAASDAVDDSIHASMLSSRFHGHTGDHDSAAVPLAFPVREEPYHVDHGRRQFAQSMQPPLPRSTNFGGSEGQNEQEISAANDPMRTPSINRQRLGPSSGFDTGLRSNTSPRNLRHQAVPDRRPLAGLSSNSNAGNGFAGYGLSAGIKVSNPTRVNSAIPVTRPSIRSRGSIFTYEFVAEQESLTPFVNRPASAMPDVQTGYGNTFGHPQSRGRTEYH